MIVFIVLAISALMTAFYTMRQITLTFFGEARSKAAEHASETPRTMTVPLSILAFFAVAAGWVGIPENFPGIGGLIPNWLHDFVGGTLLEHPEAFAFSVVPLMVSIAVALGGLLLGWLVYRNVKKGAEDPLRKPLGSLYKLFENKYYIDELYDSIFIKPATRFSEKVSYLFLDRKVIDGFLHRLARLAFSLGGFFRNKIDVPIINGSGDLTAAITQRVGKVLKLIQTGKVQQYMFFAALVTFGSLFYYVFSALR